MLLWRSVVVVALLLLGSVLSPAQAAWLETRVKAHTATVDVDRNGTAIVRHEVQLGIRGGPMREFDIAGIDVDAEPIGDATAVPVVRYGVPAPIPLVVSRADDGTLHVEIEREKGLRTGTYTFRFQYRTNLLGRDRIRRRGANAEVEWVGPRFADGIDVAKVIFRLPEGPVAPSLPSAGDGDDVLVLGSAFVSAVHHHAGKVEVEIVRPHIARGEPAVWRVLTSPKCFDGLKAPPAVAESSNAARLVSLERPKERLGWLGAALAVALGFGLLVLLKWRLHSRDCGDSAEPRACIGLPAPLRAALAGAALSAAAVLGALGDRPTLACALLIAAIVCAALRPPRLRALPRGPGRWLPLTDDDAFVGKKRRYIGRFLDAGSIPGALCCALAFALLAAPAVWILPRSPYHSLCLLLASAVLLPVFGTGRVSSLPIDRARAPSKYLARLARRLRLFEGVRVAAWARIPDGQREADELRLLVRLPRPKDGLLAIEIGFEYATSTAGCVGLPLVMVRAREGTPSHDALPREVTWQRGRRSDERVAVLRPALPALGVVSALVAEVVDQLSEPALTSSRKTSGGSSLTAKLGVRSPAHAT